MLAKIQETASFIRERMHSTPETAIILGTGLGSLVNEITEKYERCYNNRIKPSRKKVVKGELFFAALEQFVFC